MKTIEDLKQEDEIFDALESCVKSYKYLCIHPHNKAYHILIDEFEKPVRMYEKDLREILNKKLTTNKDAYALLIRNMKERIEIIENTIN